MRTENYTEVGTGNPTGGFVEDIGLAIRWQSGPLGSGEFRQEQNGAMVEDVIDAAMSRIKFFQSGKFPCQENAEALRHLEAAMGCLAARTADRVRRGVEGAHVA